MNKVLYRTNTYTDYQKWYSTPWYVIGHLPNDNIRYAVDRMWNLSNSVGSDMTGRIARVLMFDTPENEQFFNQYSVEERVNFFERAFEEYNRLAEAPLQYAVWFSTKDIVLSRANGYGKNLCKENGGVYRCYDNGIEFYTRGFDSLSLYSELPMLSPDPLVNNKLISKAELEELIAYENQAGRTLAQTCLKKDVLNVLKAARNGLIGDITPDYRRREEAIERTRDRILNDIL